MSADVRGTSLALGSQDRAISPEIESTWGDCRKNLRPKPPRSFNLRKKNTNKSPKKVEIIGKSCGTGKKKLEIIGKSCGKG
jgi:hypothetical protein